jgi:hypothetical protein
VAAAHTPDKKKLLGVLRTLGQSSPAMRTFGGLLGTAEGVELNALCAVPSGAVERLFSLVQNTQHKSQAAALEEGIETKCIAGYNNRLNLEEDLISLQTPKCRCLEWTIRKVYSQSHHESYTVVCYWGQALSASRGRKFCPAIPSKAKSVRTWKYAQQHSAREIVL